MLQCQQQLDGAAADARAMVSAAKARAGATATLAVQSVLQESRKGHGWAPKW
ncbi:hypothetical protein CNECB9_4240009 [Cupriavidus necator]|uniref:Uncharacterized protein n=1 Tax=Cupriavidus necator TaxID=106590 RepID=A0A1K0IKR4_CUPNE|nr:hypothetical protein CNECB9_4240009 [Cupriavidus necator]